MTILRSALFAAVLASGCDHASADRIVIRTNDNPGSDVYVTPNTAIVLGVPPGVNRINIFSDRTNNQANVSCPSITLNPTGAARTSVLYVVTAPEIFPIQPTTPPTVGLLRCGGFEATGTLRDWTAVSIAAVEATGSFKAGLIGRFDARIPSGSSVNLHGYAPALGATVYWLTPNAANCSIASVGVRDMVGTITAESGSIMEIGTSGSFTATVKADSGRIGQFTVPFDASLTNSLVRSRDGIGYLNTGPNSSNNTFIANFGNTSGTGAIADFSGPILSNQLLPYRRQNLGDYAVGQPGYVLLK